MQQVRPPPKKLVRPEAADLTNIDLESIKLFKFTHRQIEDNKLVKSFTNDQGATYLVAYSDLPGDLKASTASMILHELGLAPYSPPRPDHPPHLIQAPGPSGDVEESWD